MTGEQLTAKLEKLGYTHLWLESGVLTEEQLLEQEQLFDRGEDQNTEHYRYATLSLYLQGKEALSTFELEHFLELLENDPNTYMAGSAAIAVFNLVELTDEQFDWFTEKIAVWGDWTRKTVLRQTFLRKLRKEDHSHELINDCIMNGDAFVQNYLLENYRLDQKQLEALSVHGKNKRIRTAAKSHSLNS
ncbi:hypothetical protein D3C87_95900 [compost metagenome]